MPNFQRMRPAAKLASVRSRGVFGVVAAIALMSQGVGFTGDAPPIVNEKFTNLAPAIKMLRAEIGQDRRDIVVAAMLRTPSEGQTFWPLYDQYRAEEHKLGDRKVRLISDFQAQINTFRRAMTAYLESRNYSVK